MLDLIFEANLLEFFVNILPQFLIVIGATSFILFGFSFGLIFRLSQYHDHELTPF